MDSLSGVQILDEAVCISLLAFQKSIDPSPGIPWVTSFRVKTFSIMRRLSKNKYGKIKL